MLESEISKEQLVDILTRLLNDPKFQHDKWVEQACIEYPGLDGVVKTLGELRSVAFAISQGSLDESVTSRGFILSCLKGLQSNLNHLVWQLNQVSKGDFTQRIDFLGDFSDSFNAMCEKLEGQNQVLNELARQDPLTKLANRQHLDEYMLGLFDESLVVSVDFCLMIFDLDYFKRVNDTYGHEAGDIVLQCVAHYLKTVFRTSDLIARYGGEEFVVVLPNISLDQAKVIAARALDYIKSNPIHIGDEQEIKVTASVGISERTKNDALPEQVFRRSDRALYRAKRGGRDRVEWVTAEDESAESFVGAATTPIESDAAYRENSSATDSKS